MWIEVFQNGKRWRVNILSSRVTRAAGAWPPDPGEIIAVCCWCGRGTWLWNGGRWKLLRNDSGYRPQMFPGRRLPSFTLFTEFFFVAVYKHGAFVYWTCTGFFFSPTFYVFSKETGNGLGLNSRKKLILIPMIKRLISQILFQAFVIIIIFSF